MVRLKRSCLEHWPSFSPSGAKAAVLCTWSLQLKYRFTLFTLLLVRYQNRYSFTTPPNCSTLPALDKCKLLLFIIIETVSIFQAPCSQTIIPLIIILLSRHFTLQIMTTLIQTKQLHAYPSTDEWRQKGHVHPATLQSLSNVKPIKFWIF